MSAARPLIVMALESESQSLIEKAGFDVLYCGVGKINAAHALMRRLAALRTQSISIPLVLNLGSAGSPRFATGEVVEATRFVQRDMDATGIGFPYGTTPFDPHPAVFESSAHFAHLATGTCGSGDSFLQGAPPIACDIIDMEAYALAKVCHLESVPFACVKYITDGADGNAHTDWQENLQKAAQAFVTLLFR